MTAAGRERRGIAPFRYRGYTILWTGALVSNIGTWMETVALSYYVADTTGKATWAADRRRRRLRALGRARPDRVGDVGPPAPRPDPRRDERAVGRCSPRRWRSS